MKRLILLGLILSCFLLPDAVCALCNLAGNWRNDLGSNMTITAVSNDGAFSGTYLTAVTSTNKTYIRVSTLIGFQQLNENQTFGFTVKWNFTDSITVFTGQCFNDGANGKVLWTTWLLKSHSNSISDNWMQTRVGFNVFYPIPEEPTMKPE